MRATPLVWRCFALRFAFRKTLAEQSALARLQASLQTRFVLLSCVSPNKVPDQICTKITPTLNAYSARQIGFCCQLFKLNISCICFYFASPTDRFSDRSSWYLNFTRVSASYKHHIRRQSATNTSCISFHKNFRGRAIV